MGSPEREQQLAAHLSATYPTSRQSFLGKEHFWAFGAQAGVARRYVGTLFSELCFPIKGNPLLAYSSDISAVDPAELGLVIMTRDELGIPVPPVPFCTTSASKSLVAHGVRRHRAGDANRVMTERMVQMQGVIDLGPDLETTAADFTAKTRETMGLIMPRLLAVAA